MKRAFAFLFLLASAAHAQAPSPAQMGMTPTTPQSLEVLDKSKTWVPIGGVDPMAHIFGLHFNGTLWREIARNF